MDVTFAHLCDYATVSREGKLSVLGIFSQINGLQVPLTHPQAYLAFEIEINYAEVGRKFTLEIQIVDEDGEKMFTAQAAGSFQTGAPPKPGESPPRLSQIIAFNNLSFKRFGTYNINVFLNEQLKKQLDFRVVQSPPTTT